MRAAGGVVVGIRAGDVRITLRVPIVVHARANSSTIDWIRSRIVTTSVHWVCERWVLVRASARNFHLMTVSRQNAAALADSQDYYLHPSD